MTTNRPEAGVPTPPETRRDGSPREFARRIECDAGSTREPHAVAARGRGVRNLEARTPVRDPQG